MTITVLDTCTGIATVLDAPASERSDRLAAMLAPMAGMYRYFPGEVDLLAMHRMSFGFPIDGDTTKCRDALATLHGVDAWGRISRALDEALALQLAATPTIEVPDITVLIVLGNPDDVYFMEEAQGVSGNGSAFGYISLTIWPTPQNLARLEATAVHELHHNLRYCPGGVTWDPALVDVGEQVISEGLADAFARQIHGDEIGYSLIGVPHLSDDAVFAMVVSGLEVTGMENFTAWIHGDAATRRFGGEPVGLPTGAGYAAGNRLVDIFLSKTGRTAADALHIASREIIDVALGRN